MGEETVTIPKREYEALKGLVVQLQGLVVQLQAEIQLLKNGKKSDTSSTPPSQDIGRSNRKSLREKSGKKSGGQKGHSGHTLKQRETPDEIIKHEAPEHCAQCGESLAGTGESGVEKRQEVEVRIVTWCVEHQSGKKVCPHCGGVSAGEFPAHLKAPIQYGGSVQALLGYLSIYQYMPYNRIQQFMMDITGLDLSEGTVDKVLEKTARAAESKYEEIRRELEMSGEIGSDETGCRISGKREWMYIFQNGRNSYLVPSRHRDYQTIKDAFPNGFPQGTLVSDCLAAQLKVNAARHQICCAHLLRELKNFEDALGDEWSSKLKGVIKEALALKNRMKGEDYDAVSAEVMEIERKTDELLEADHEKAHKKLRAFMKRLKKHRDKLYTFLYYPDVPADNNGSERGIRNMKVKTKISGQFRTFAGAERFAKIRSVVDTAIKNGLNIFTVFSNLSLTYT